MQNHPNHLKGFLLLTKILLQLVLEYPGLPSGIAGRTSLGQALKDVGVHRENYSELLKMFLLSRDEEGKKVLWTYVLDYDIVSHLVLIFF